MIEAALTNPTQRPVVKSFFDPATFTVSHVVRDPGSNACAIIDSVLDYDQAAGRTSTASADALIAYVEAEDLEVQWLLETHAHADHLSAAPYLQERLGGRLAIGRDIIKVQDVFGKVFNEGTKFRRDGSQFDQLFDDGDRFAIGGLQATVLHVPGHTPRLSGLCDRRRRLPRRHPVHAGLRHGALRLPRRRRADAASLDQAPAVPAPAARVFLCHDYKAPPARTEFAWETTIGAQREGNIHVRDGVTEDEFVQMRTARDATLSMPRLILPSVQVNMNGGRMPEPEDNGVRYLKVPINAL